MVRLKHRYLIIRLFPKDQKTPIAVERDKIISYFTKPFVDQFGDFGSGNVLPTMKMISWNNDLNVGVIRIVRDWAENYKTFLTTLHHNYSLPFYVDVPHVSGTVDQAQRWIDDNNFELTKPIEI